MSGDDVVDLATRRRDRAIEARRSALWERMVGPWADETEGQSALISTMMDRYTCEADPERDLGYPDCCGPCEVVRLAERALALAEDVQELAQEYVDDEEVFVPEGELPLDVRVEVATQRLEIIRAAREVLD